MGSEWLEDIDFGTDYDHRIDWSKKNTYSDIFAYFCDLISLRKGVAALHADAGVQVFHENESGNVLGFQRWAEGEVVVVVANFSNNDYAGYRLGLPQPGAWHEAINSQDVAYGGSGMNNPLISVESVPAHGFGQSTLIDVPQMGLLVLRLGDQVSAPEDGTVAAAPRILGASPNPFNPWTRLAFSLPEAGPAKLDVFNVQGRRVATLLDRQLEAGHHETVWRAGDAPSGVYLARLNSLAGEDAWKLVLLR